MTEISAKSFLDLLNQSGIVAPEELRPALSELKKIAAGKSVKLDLLTKHLIESGLITDWHVQKLVSGKYRGFFLGKYKLLRHLGTGGMSTVYLAQHTIFNQKRAIKVLPKKRIDDKSYLDRFYREGRAAASLNHKNIVRVYDIDNDGNTHYLVMEYVNGNDIYEMVRENGPLDYRTAVDFTIQSLTGLQHAHSNNLVHRDIKPANLLVTPDGVVKILDLGLALFREDETSLTVMHNEKVLGTADYLSPEQAVDSHNVDHRADVYSLGCTLYYMLTGKPPFYEGTIAQRIAMHQARMPETIMKFREDCPNRLEKICFKMMAKKPDDRYQKCNELVPILRGLLEELPETTAAPSTASAGVDLQAAKDTPSVKSLPTKGPVIRTRDPKKSAEVKGQKETTAAPAAQKRAPGKPQPRQLAGQQSPASKGKPKTANRNKTSVETPPADRRGKPKPEQTKAVAPSSKPVRSPDESPQRSAGAKPAPSRPPSPAKSSSPQRVQKQQPTDMAVISVITEEVKLPSVVGKSELQEFRSHVPVKRTVVRRTGFSKDQWIVTGIVIGMVILLGTVLGVAMRLTNRTEPEKDSRVFERDIAIVRAESTDLPQKLDCDRFQSRFFGKELIQFVEMNRCRC